MLKSLSDMVLKAAGVLPAVAVPSDFTHRPILVRKADAKKQIVFGEVYAPGVPDSQGDFMTAETIEVMAHGFLKKSAMQKIDIQHDRIDCGAMVVESFIARDDDPIFIPGSWVIGVHVPDSEQWGMIEKGELNGFSLDGMGLRVETMLEFELPDELKGRTTQAGNPPHDHEFVVKYDKDGNFLGGETDVGPDGVKHIIKSGTVTEKANDHDHRYSFAEGFLEAVNG